ncbi:MAG: hypothetical protein HYX38_16630 [Rhodospirillales bacterium]|nr:hypothetical protein [Rhodospirillales bacterium]
MRILPLTAPAASKHLLADATEMARTFATLDPAWQAVQRVAKMFGLQ